MGIARVVRSQWLKARIARARSQQNYSQALASTIQLEALRPLSLAEQVDKGLLMIGSDDADGAHNLLSSLRDKFAASPSAEEQFLGNVADYWLAVIEGDPERAAMVSRRAEQIEYRGSLTRRFRIPPAEPQRSVDIEFEAIMTRTTLENRRPHPSRSERD